MTTEPEGRLFGRPIRPKDPARSAPRPEDVAFVHASELLFARLLDFYGIDWEYEPRSFDLAVDDTGRPTERFTPDFYLPEYDLYVEITTMAQRLVTRKNRKIRRLAERYPEIRCRIFYQRDIENLATKLGLEVPTEDFTALDEE